MADIKNVSEKILVYNPIFLIVLKSKSYLYDYFTKKRIYVPISVFPSEIKSFLDEKIVLTHENDKMLRLRDLYTGNIIDEIEAKEYEIFDNYILTNRGYEEKVFKYSKELRKFEKVEIPKDLHLINLDSIRNDKIIFTGPNSHITIYDLATKTSNKIQTNNEIYEFSYGDKFLSKKVGNWINIRFLEDKENRGNKQKVIQIPSTSDYFAIDKEILFYNWEKYYYVIENGKNYSIIVEDEKILFSPMLKFTKEEITKMNYIGSGNVYIVTNLNRVYIFNYLLKRQMKIPQKVVLEPRNNKDSDSEDEDNTYFKIKDLSQNLSQNVVMFNDYIINLENEEIVKIEKNTPGIIYPFASKKQIEDMISNIETNMIPKDIKRIIAKFI